MQLRRYRLVTLTAIIIAPLIYMQWTGQVFAANAGGLPACKASLSLCNNNISTCQSDLTTCKNNLSNAPAFPATGQTTSFNPGDDGAIRAGAPLSYMDNGDGTIT